MIDIYELLDKITISNKLVYYINTKYKNMTNQLRFSLGRLNGITSIEIMKFINLTDITDDELSEYASRFPKNVFVMQQHIYLLLGLIILKAKQLGMEQLAQDTNTLLGLIILARLKYKYIRVVNHDVLDKTINGLSKKSYIGLHGLLWMVNKVTKDTYDRWMPQVVKDPKDYYPMYRYIIDMRNKFNQITKIIARIYYYNIVHQNDVDRSQLIRTRTSEIINTLSSKALPDRIIQIIVDLCKPNVSDTSLERINNLHYNVQVYQSIQTHLTILINNILDKLWSYMEVYKNQFDKNLDINDPLFLRTFYTGLKRSTIMLRLSDDQVFKVLFPYDRFEVLAYAFICTLYVDSSNHSSTYYGEGKTTSMDNDSMDYGRIEEDPDPSDNMYMDESLDYPIRSDVRREELLEEFFDGIMEDQDLFELFSMRGDY